MAVLLPSNVHGDTFMANVAVRLMNQPSSYIAAEVYPVIPVKKESDKYLVHREGSWFRNEAQEITHGGRVPVLDYGVTEGDYSCKHFGAASVITRRTKANADSIMRLIENKTAFVLDKVLMKRESYVASHIMSTTIWTNNSTPTTKWDAADCTPAADIYAGIDDVEDNSGVRPNVIVFGAAAYRLLRNNQYLFAEMFPNAVSSTGIISVEALKNFFDMSKVLVGKSAYTADEETLTDTGPTLTKFWGLDVWVGFVSPTPSPDIPSAGYIFQADMEFRPWFETATQNTVVEASANEAVEQVCVAAGHVIYTIET